MSQLHGRDAALACESVSFGRAIEREVDAGSFQQVQVSKDGTPVHADELREVIDGVPVDALQSVHDLEHSFDAIGLQRSTPCELQGSAAWLTLCA